jgi:hypothetical protein
LTQGWGSWMTIPEVLDGRGTVGGRSRDGRGTVGGRSVDGSLEDVVLDGDPRAGVQRWSAQG